jgi:glycosyltransferase involved in cell wall biosynthesis
MAAGLPVVASKVGGVPELVVDGETGFLPEPGDDEALASAVARLVADAGLRRRMGDSGRARVAERFDLSSFYRAHAGLYRRELERAGVAP